MTFGPGIAELTLLQLLKCYRKPCYYDSKHNIYQIRSHMQTKTKQSHCRPALKMYMAPETNLNKKIYYSSIHFHSHFTHNSGKSIGFFSWGIEICLWNKEKRCVTWNYSIFQRNGSEDNHCWTNWEFRNWLWNFNIMSYVLRILN